jgi:carbonic anhydrase/acetyltransferase-like protein (isoleucine patch superfamily)
MSGVLVMEELDEMGAAVGKFTVIGEEDVVSEESAGEDGTIGDKKSIVTGTQERRLKSQRLKNQKSHRQRTVNTAGESQEATSAEPVLFDEVREETATMENVSAEENKRYPHQITPQRQHQKKRKTYYLKARLGRR